MQHFDQDGPQSPAQPAWQQACPPAERTVATLLARRTAAHGDRPVLVIGGERYRSGDLARRASAVAATLRDAGVAAGDRVAILCGNRIEFIDLFLACAWLGAIAVPVNLSSRGAQLAHILRDSGARLLAIDDDAVAALDHLDPASVAIETVWLLPGVAPTAGTARWPCRPMPDPAGCGVPPMAVDPADTAAILYTSGTTGPSKGVCCPHAQFFWWGANTIDILEIVADDVLLTTLPLFHVNALGTLYQALLSGATMVVLPRFSASGFLSALREHRATVTYLLGAMVPILLTRPATADDRDHGVRCALAPGVPGASAAQFTERYGIGLIEGYGSTETNFVIGDVLAEQQPGAMGRVRPGYAAQVFDAQDNAVPDGTPGELVIRSDIPFSMATGYFGLPEATADSRRNLWFHTGDRVYRDTGGRFYFMDRMKDAIRRRGENISAYEVEQVLLGHPAVAQAAVFPVASELGEDEVMAAIVRTAGAHVAETGLLDFCQPRMPYFSVPRYILFLDALPLTDNGKVRKFRLREQGVTADTWDREAAGYEVRRPQRAARP